MAPAGPIGHPARRGPALAGLAGLALLPVLVLAACGSSSPSSGSGPAAALARIHQAVARTGTAGTAHLVESTDTQSTTGGTSTEPVSADSLTVVGDLAFAGPDASLTTTSRSTLPSSSGGAGPATPSSSTTTSSVSVWLGPHLYQRVPPGPVWTELPVRAPFNYLGVVPTRFLETAPGPVTDAGHREIDGQATTGYLVPVPSSEHGVSLSDSHNRPYTDRFTTAPFTVAVWLDGAGRIVRASGTEVVTSTRPAGTARQTTTVTLSAFGAPVHIVAPTVTQPG